MQGISEFYAGRADEALDDVRTAANLEHQNFYAMLWVHIVEGRIGGTSTLGERSKYSRLNRWPAPIVRMIMGEISRDDAVNEAMQSYSTTRALKLCEIDFYSGQNALIMGHRDEAKRLLESAAATCVPEMDFTNWWPGFIEREAAGRDRGTLDRR
jgi:lipoprotein NlpI